jgi:hypothetical protein
MTSNLKKIFTVAVAAAALTTGTLALAGEALAKGKHHHHRHHHYRHWGAYSVYVADSSCSWRWVQTRWGLKKIYNCDDDD